MTHLFQLLVRTLGTHEDPVVSSFGTLGARDPEGTSHLGVSHPWGSSRLLVRLGLRPPRMAWTRG